MVVFLLQLRNENYLHPRFLKELAAYRTASNGPCVPSIAPSSIAHYNFLKHNSDKITTLLKTSSVRPRAYRKKRSFL